MRFAVVKNPGFITATSIGGAFAPALNAAGGLTSADDADGAFLSHGTGLQGGAGGVISSFDVFQRGWELDIDFEVKIDGTDPLEPDLRCWIGVFSANPDSLSDPALPGMHLAAFRIDTSQLLNPLRLTTWTGSGTLGQTVPPLVTPINVAFNDRLLLRILCKNNPVPQIEFKVKRNNQSEDSYAIHMAAHDLPAAAQPLGYGIRVKGLGTTNRTIRWSRIAWDYNPKT